MQRILLVEDEEHLKETLKLNLELEGYEVVAVDDGRQVMPTFLQQHFDLVLLDVMLPHLNGFELCEQLRLHNSLIPIIFLTAKDTPADKVQGLRLGADDYLTKPFHLEELLLRIQNLLKRRLPNAQAQLDKAEFGGNTIDFHNYEAQTWQGQQLTLTKKEALLLKLLIERAGEVVSRQQILQSVWGYDVYPSTRTIDNFILSFRKYFEENPKEPKHFHSIRGVGYRFDP
jgi:two-component system alkaline phosphatase synthesis response regulator PhoP